MSNRFFASAFVAVALGVAAPAAAQTALGPAEAVERALRNNPSLAAAVIDTQSARWNVVRRETAFSPRLQLDAAAQHSESASLGPTGFFLAETDVLSLGAGLTQQLKTGTDLSLRLQNNTQWNQNRTGGLFSNGPLYDSSARLELTQPLLRGAWSEVNTAELRVAEAQQTEAQRAAVRDASVLVRDVLVSWGELWYADEALRIERESLQLAEQQLADARRRVELGTAAPVSVLAFETRVAERMEAVATAERTRQQQAVALGALLGEASPSFGVAESALAPVQAPQGEAVVEEALRASPEVREAEAAVHITEIQASVAADPSRPRLDVQGFAEVGKLAPTFVGLGDGDSQTAWSAGVNLIFEVPLDGREHQAAAAQARLSLQAAQRRLEQTKLSVESAVEQELARVESAAARVRLAGQTVDVAERQLAAEQARYRTGSATSLDVLEAEEDVRNARLRLARAEVDLRSSTASIEHQTGALLTRWLPDGLASL